MTVSLCYVFFSPLLCVNARVDVQWCVCMCVCIWVSLLVFADIKLTCGKNLTAPSHSEDSWAEVWSSTSTPMCVFLLCVSLRVGYCSVHTKTLLLIWLPAVWTWPAIVGRPAARNVWCATLLERPPLPTDTHTPSFLGDSLLLWAGADRGTGLTPKEEWFKFHSW